jgi:hypothetical protein
MAKDNDRTTKIGFIVFFLGLIVAVPLIQSVIEYRRDRRIQMLDLFIDTGVTPWRNAKDHHALAVSTRRLVDSIAVTVAASGDSTRNSYPVEQLLDEALVAVSDLQRSVAKINRHVVIDTAAESFDRLRELATRLNSLMVAVRKTPPVSNLAESIGAAREQAEKLVSQYPAPSLLDYPGMAAANLRYIFWTDKYLRPYEKEMENTSVFTVALRPRMQFVYYSLFGELGEKGLKGSHDWFFYKNDVDYLIKPSVLDPRSLAVDPNEKPLTDNPVTAILAFKEQLADRGIDLLVVAIPGKPSIYPELLAPSMHPKLSGKISHTPDILDTLRSHGVAIVDLYAPFSRERQNDSIAGDSLYLEKDTHWRARGVVTAAHEIAEHIKAYPWYQAGTTEFIIDTVVVDRVGDIGVMSTLPLVRVGGKQFAFPVEKTACYQVSQVSRDEAGAETGRALYKDDYRNAQILLLGDSFSRIYQTDEPRSAGLVAHLARELSQPIASIVSDGGASTLVRQTLARKANLLKGKKLVVWEFIERDLRYGAEGWKTVAL